MCEQESCQKYVINIMPIAYITILNHIFGIPSILK